MDMKKSLAGVIFSILVFVSTPICSFGQANGTLRGTVTLDTGGKPVGGVVVTVLRLNRTAVTNDDGVYEIPDVPAGSYSVVAHLDGVPDVAHMVTVSGATTADFQLRLRGVTQQVTVTATGDAESAFNSIQAVEIVPSSQILEKNTQSLGDVLENELGVAKRTFGPGTSRPVIRGFDGDRVLILRDGNRTGSLGFQSGDHGEPADLLNLEKVEVVKGPATLLYGSNAIGGVVNTITGHDSAHEGLRGFVTGIGSSNNWQGGGGGGLEYGTKNWLLWGNGSGQRAGDYETKDGRVPNSYTRDGSGSGGFGYYPGKSFLSLDYSFNKRRYGIPFDPSEEDPEVVFLNPRVHGIRLNGGVRDLESSISGAQFSLQYNDYKHQEINPIEDVINTQFRNKVFSYRGVFDHRAGQRFSGSFGLSGLHRDFSSSGEESLAPPTTQNNFALFALEKVEFERMTVQFGGRFEHNGYRPDQGVVDRPTPDRTFNGASGSVGLRIPTWTGGAFLVNYSHSYRARPMEELYNLGPHAGNSTFEVGDPNLKREEGDGVDFSIRHSNNRVRAEGNYFYYHIKDFVFLAPTGEDDEESGLPIANYTAGTTRYTGAEGRLDVALHPNFWLLTGIDYVNAKLTDSGTPLPRIPPLRGRIGFELSYKGFRANPEVVMARDQDRTFTNETRTAGYTVFNANASYSFAAGPRAAQTVSFTAFNIGDRVYRNHLSFIKEFAPEIGRGFRLNYSLRFF
jgi:iron complex outermembrane receptor protein